MKKTGLLMALLLSTGATSLDAITPQDVKGDQCRLISEFADLELQDIIGDALQAAHQSKQPVEASIPRKLGLKKFEYDLGALSLIYTISNNYGLIVKITPTKVLVTDSKHTA